MSKKAYIFVLILVFLAVFSMQSSAQAQTTQTPDKLSINQPYFYFTQVHFREIENVRIFVECPLTNSDFAKQNVTFRISIHNLGNNKELVIVKNGVVITLEKRMVEDSYYIQPIYIDNPLGTNCTVKLILKTSQTDFTVLELIYVVSRIDPSLPYDEYTHYWTDNMVDEAEEKLEQAEKEKYIKMPQSDFIFTVIGIIIGGVALFYTSEWLGISGIKRTLIKSRKLSKNPVLGITLIIVFIVIFILFLYFFWQPITLDQEAKMKAKYLGTEYISPVPATEWLERIAYFTIFSALTMILFFGIRHGWKLYKLDDAFMAITIKDQERTPGVDIVIDIEEGVLRQDPDNPHIKRWASGDKLNAKEGWRRVLYGIRRCLRVFLDENIYNEELTVRLRECEEEYPAMLLDSRDNLENIDERIDAQYIELQDKLDALYKDIQEKGKLSLLKRLQLKLLKLKTGATEKGGEFWVMACSHTNKVGTLFDKDIAMKSQLSEREAVAISQEMTTIARTSKDLSQARVLTTMFKQEVDMTEEAVDELNDTEKERTGFDSIINKIDKVHRAPEPEM